MERAALLEPRRGDGDARRRPRGIGDDASPGAGGAGRDCRRPRTRVFDGEQGPRHQSRVRARGFHRGRPQAAAGPAGRRRVRAADRVRERREPPPRARERSPTRARDPHRARRDAPKDGDGANPRRQRLLPALVVVEIALGLVLTASAGLMIRTMSQLWSVHPGFNPEGVLTFGVAGSPAVHGSPAVVRNGLAQTANRMRAVPGVTAVSALGGGLPMSGNDSELPYWVDGRPKPAEQSQMDLALFYGVDPDYLRVMGIPLLRGRFLSAQDDERRPCVVAIDEAFAARAFPNRDPIGQHINLELLTMKCEIVGIVGHVKHWGLDADATSKVQSQMYIPFRQFPDNVMDLASTGVPWVVRAGGDPYALVPSVRRAIAEVSGSMV